MEQDVQPSVRQSFFVRALVAPTDSNLWQLVRFAITGGLATVVDYAVMLTLRFQAHISQPISVAVGFFAGLVVCYVLSVIWIFTRRSLGSRQIEFLVFAIIGVIGLGLTELVVAAGQHFLQAHPDFSQRFSPKLQLSMSKAFAIFCVTFFNFMARKTLLFSGQRK